jgi:hypothetical protein
MEKKFRNCNGGCTKTSQPRENLETSSWPLVMGFVSRYRNRTYCNDVHLAKEKKLRGSTTGLTLIWLLQYMREADWVVPSNMFQNRAMLQEERTSRRSPSFHAWENAVVPEGLSCLAGEVMKAGGVSGRSRRIPILLQQIVWGCNSATFLVRALSCFRIRNLSKRRLATRREYYSTINNCGADVVAKCRFWREKPECTCRWKRPGQGILMDRHASLESIF